MFKNRKISLVLPCKNEADNLVYLVSTISHIVDEIIVVDNQSSDNTSKIAATLNTIVIKEPKHINGIGYGYAIMTGISKAKGDIIIVADGDGTYPLDSVDKIINFMVESNYDFVSCSRSLSDSNHSLTLTRKMGIQFLNKMTTILYGYQIKDLLSGMWIFNKSVLKKIKLEQGNWNLSCEIKLKALSHRQVKFSEYMIDYHPRYSGQSHQNIVKTGFDHAVFVLNFWFKKARQKKIIASYA